jgi:putative CocE/NonD family hydrolase
MIPMRDGVKLCTVILIPRGAQRAPILLSRTPYGADERFGQVSNKHLSALLGSKDVVDELVLNEGYIRVLQDVRGKHHSEGDYVMTRPLRGPLNPTNVDHSTDTYDTIDWLVKNIPESNGKVGILGISYDGFTALMALFHPHPALRAAMPINPMVDGWMRDDWSHNGAFRQFSLVYWYDQEATRGAKENGGRITTTTTNPGWPLARLAKWPGFADLIRWGFIKNSWRIRHMMTSGKSKL